MIIFGQPQADGALPTVVLSGLFTPSYAKLKTDNSPLITQNSILATRHRPLIAENFPLLYNFIVRPEHVLEISVQFFSTEFPVFSLEFDYWYYLVFRDWFLGFNHGFSIKSLILI